jgi:signal transduction histidine kinase
MAKRRQKKRPGKRPHAQSRGTRRASPRGNAIEAALAGIAHDIRTPLTGIVALAELLASSDLGTREREWANAIKSGADHLAALATLIVDGAKSGVKDLFLRNEAFSPGALAEAVGATLAARADNKAAKAETRIARDLPAMVSGDVLRLRAALENLADNAVKFTHEGAVTFTADGESAERNRVRLIFTFADSGIGMSAAELKNYSAHSRKAAPKFPDAMGGRSRPFFVKRVANAKVVMSLFAAKGWRVDIPPDRDGRPR